MPTFHVPVVRKILDVYEIEAKNTIDAAVQVGIWISSGAAPTSSKELSRNVMQPRKPDDVHTEDTDQPRVGADAVADQLDAGVEDTAAPVGQRSEPGPAVQGRVRKGRPT